MTQSAARRLSEWMSLCLEQWPESLASDRVTEYTALTDDVVNMLADDRPLWSQLPGAVANIFGKRGWAWNGFYIRHGEQLDLAEGAVGPPVCATLLLGGSKAAGSSGACWDAILMNQSIVLRDVKQWPGYVSCDGESRLQTKAGMVCPIRDGDCRPIAVWDLDAERELASADAPFMSRLFETLSVLLKPGPDDLG